MGEVLKYPFIYNYYEKNHGNMHMGVSKGEGGGR